MDIFTPILIILGLAVFESINSVDNAVINAEILTGVSKRTRKWFLTWGMLISVLIVRGLLPLVIVWFSIPHLGLSDTFTATFSSDPRVLEAIHSSSPVLLLGAGVFLLLLFLHWLFLEPKHFGLRAEKFFLKNGLWFFATASVFLCVIVWHSLQVDPILAFGATVGSSAFFLVNGFKQSAAKAELELKESRKSDLSKIIYLEMLDAAFSVDGVLGAFAFTLSIPLILLGNGLGALVVRYMTVSNIDKIGRYIFLKHGAMYSIFFLGLIMLAHGFGIHVPEYFSPLMTFIVIGYFYLKSRHALTLSSTA